MSPENINQCLESMKSEVVKQELKSVTDEAVDRGKKFSKKSKIKILTDFMLNYEGHEIFFRCFWITDNVFHRK